MKAIYLVRYRMVGQKTIHLYTTFTKSLPSALAAFHAFMGSKGAEHFQYQHLNHREIMERDFKWHSHQRFLEKLPREELIEFLEIRSARQIRERGTPDQQTKQLINHFGVTV